MKKVKTRSSRPNKPVSFKVTSGLNDHRDHLALHYFGEHSQAAAGQMQALIDAVIQKPSSMDFCCLICKKAFRGNAFKVKRHILRRHLTISSSWY